VPDGIFLGDTAAISARGHTKVRRRRQGGIGRGSIERRR
jgi:hypothetical protein